NLTRHCFSLPLAPVAVTWTSMLSPADAEPEPPPFEQWFLLVEFTVHEMSIAPVVLSITATNTVSLPVTLALESAYRLFGAAPLFGVGPARSLLFDHPVVFAGQD